MRHRRSKRGLIVGGIAAGILIAAAIVIGLLWFQKREETEKEKTPEELLMEYTEYILSLIHIYHAPWQEQGKRDRSNSKTGGLPCGWSDSFSG